MAFQSGFLSKGKENKPVSASSPAAAEIEEVEPADAVADTGSFAPVPAPSKPFSGGFLEEKEKKPVSASALEELFSKTQAEARRLRRILDPEETPYESRYEERRQLLELSKQAEANEKASADGAAKARARVMRACADGQIGRNFMDTEEGGSAQAKLESAIEGLEGVAEEAVAYVEALNNLGVVWCNRGEPEKALGLLERARDAHAAHVAAIKTGERQARDESADAVRIEDACTLTTFYLAQVYGAVGRRTESAGHVHETMRRQLARRDVSAAADAAAQQAADARGGAGAGLQFGSESKSEFCFDATEWARNACDLSRYYATVERLDVAEHCLLAAERVLAGARNEQRRLANEAKEAAEKEKAALTVKAVVADVEAAADVTDAPAAADKKDPVNRIFLNGTANDKKESEEAGEAQRLARQEKDKAQQQTQGVAALSEDEAEQVALVDLAWAKLWQTAIKQAAELRIRTGEAEEAAIKKGLKGAEVDKALADVAASPVDEEGEEGKALGPLAKLAFSQLKLPATTPILAQMATKVRAFDGAKELFQLGIARCARAKATLVLDGFVTMHFEVLEVESGLYRNLALWETDPARKHAMHKRRVELLRGPVGELNEKAYCQLVRQGLFDMSSIACEMLEVKAAQHANDPPARKNKKLEAPVAYAVEACNEFLKRFDEPKRPDRVEEEQERAYVQTCFQRARAHGKLDLSVDSLALALKEYKYLGEYLTRNKVEGSEDEAAAAKEMASLLPMKIEQAKIRNSTARGDK